MRRWIILGVIIAIAVIAAVLVPLSPTRHTDELLPAARLMAIGDMHRSEWLALPDDERLRFVKAHLLAAPHCPYSPDGIAQMITRAYVTNPAASQDVGTTLVGIQANTGCL